MEPAEGVKVDKLTAPVSVIIPYYNSSSTIRRALDSVFAQTRLPLEIIVVDDGSFAEELMSLKETVAAFSGEFVATIKLVSLANNSGPSAARNAGWELSTQPYLAFLDADDSWFRNKIELQYGWMSKYPDVVLTAHKCNLSDLPGSRIDGDTSIEVKPITKWALLLSGLFSTPSVMLRTNIPFRFDESIKYCEDHYLWLLIVLNNMPAFFFNNDYATIHKSAYGAGGLSSHLWRMEKGELIQYRKLHNAGLLNVISYGLITVYSLLKYLRRVAIVRFRN